MINKGFTLIELMIVVAIISILVSIAVPLYQSYVAKSQITAAITELNGARVQYELIMNDGSSNNTFSVDNMGFAALSSSICNYIVYPPINGVSQPALECQMHNVATIIEGKSVFLNRQISGAWKCSTASDIPINVKPNDCV